MTSTESDEPRELTPEEQRYIDDLVTRGEAADPDEQGRLPPGATHEIVERAPDGRVLRVARRRMSPY
jgi:hypothetical protein